jgi:hypothetical protein
MEPGRGVSCQAGRILTKDVRCREQRVTEWFVQEFLCAFHTVNLQRLRIGNHCPHPNKSPILQMKKPGTGRNGLGVWPRSQD